MKDQLILCTNNVHFSFNGGINTQSDGTAMSSPFGLVLAGTFMVELEQSIEPN